MSAFVSENQMLTDQDKDVSRKNNNHIKKAKINYWNRRSRLEKMLIIVLILSILSSLALIIALIVTNDNKELKICENSQCLIAASTIQQSIDKNINPCDDFYSFACGSWQKSNPIPNDRSRWGQYDRAIKNTEEKLKFILENDFHHNSYSPAVKQAFNFYKGCINATLRDASGYTLLRDILSNITWPLIDFNWDMRRDNYKWENVYSMLNKKIGANFIFSNNVHLDAKNTSHYSIHINIPSFGLSRETLRNPDVEYNKNIISAYKKLIRKSVELLSNPVTIIESIVEKDIDLLVSFEIKLAKLTPNTTRTGYGNYGNKTTIKNFMKNYEGIPLLNINKIIFNDIYSGKNQITENEKLIVYNKQYFKELINVLKETDKRTIANYFGWRLVQQLAPHTTQKYRSIVFEFSQTVTGVVEPMPLWEECIGVTVSTFGYAIGRVYIDHTFSVDAKRDIESLIDRIRTAFLELMSENEWMHEMTKEKAVKKLNAIHTEIGYPDFILNNTLLENFYDGLRLGDIQESFYFTSILRYMHWYKRKWLKKLRIINTDKSKLEWFVSPTIVNAFYSVGLNRMTFPSGIMQSPFYTHGLPVSLNFGAIGSIIGHEITHGFDDFGSQFDMNGNFINDWWDESTKSRFKKKVKCFIEQYENFYESHSGLMIKGSETIGENIADNGGVRQAYRAFKNYDGPKLILPGSMKEFTSEQLFFLSFANVWCTNIRHKKLIQQIETDPHSPHKYRVLGSISNLPEFAEAFNCKDGDKMNRPYEQKCILW